MLFTFICDQCGKGFLKYSKLITHKLSHTDEDPSCLLESAVLHETEFLKPSEKEVTVEEEHVKSIYSESATAEGMSRRSSTVADALCNLDSTAIQEPLDVRKKIASTATKSQFLFSDKKRVLVKEEKPITLMNTIFSHEELSILVEKIRSANEQVNTKSAHSHQINNESETLVSQDTISGSRVRNKRKMSPGHEIDSGAETHKHVESDSNPDIKDKPSHDCSDRAVRDCISPKPSTSAGVGCSYDFSAIQGPPFDPNQVIRFNCRYCSKGFQYHSTYEKHVQCHTGETPYECEYCDRKCSTAGGLARHKRVHPFSTKDLFSAKNTAGDLISQIVLKCMKNPDEE